MYAQWHYQWKHNFYSKSSCSTMKTLENFFFSISKTKTNKNEQISTNIVHSAFCNFFSFFLTDQESYAAAWPWHTTNWRRISDLSKCPHCFWCFFLQPLLSSVKVKETNKKSHLRKMSSYSTGAWNATFAGFWLPFLNVMTTHVIPWSETSRIVSLDSDV